MQVNTIGVDLAKNVFQVHGVDSAGKVVISRQLRRKQVIDFFRKIPPCLVGMEACGTAHHWAREVSKLGHTVRLRATPIDAVRADQVGRSASRADVAPNTGSFDPSAHAADQ